MKLVAVMCFSIVFYVDSVCGMSIEELFSYIPGWDTITKTWNQIKEAIKKPVKLRRWGRDKRRKTTTTMTLTNSTVTASTESLITGFSKIMMNTSMNDISNSKTLSALLNSREIVNTRFHDNKTFFHFIYLPSLENSLTSSLHLNSTEKPAVPVIQMRSSINAFTPKKSFNAAAKKSRSIKVRISTTRSLRNTIVYFSSTEKSRSTTITSLSPATASTSLLNKIFKNLTISPDFLSINTVNDTKINLPYIPNPTWRSAEDWNKLQAPPHAEVQATNVMDNDTETAIALEGDTSKGLSEEKDAEYSFFGSLVFI